MFWGLTLEGAKKHSQKVEQAFHVTTAALKVPVLQQDADKIYPVYVNYNGKEFLLCSLAPSSGIYQVALGLQFEAGAKVEFRVEGGGSSRVYLTGFTISTQDPLLNLVSTPVSSSAISIPIKAQQSILISGKKKCNENHTEKRVSIADKHEEKTYEKDSEDEVELDSDEEDSDEDGIIEELDESLSDVEDIFNLEDSDEDEEEEEDGVEMEEQDLVDEEEPSFFDIAKLFNGKGDKKKKKKGKLSFSDEEPSPKGVKVDPKSTAPPAKKQKMDDSKNKTPPQVKTPEMKKQLLKTPSSAGHTPMKVLTKGGVMITEVRIGTGPQAKAGKKVKVSYVGRLQKNGEVFDRGDIGFHLGKAEVIKGWDVGIEGMKVGGKRKLIIPPKLAYGKNGAAPAIPPNSTLVFEVELKQA